MSAERDFVSRVRAVAVWKRGNERAPHKPLFLLYALGQFRAGRTRISFRECRTDLIKLLKEFGPSRHTYHPEYPFWRLQSDGLWEVQAGGRLTRRASNTDPTAKALTDLNAVGEFPADLQRAMQRDEKLISQAAQLLLENHFADSLHADIRNAVGLSPDQQIEQKTRRDPSFRRMVLQSYRYACAVCGFSLRLEDTTIGLDAAHIKWRQAEGPDVASNGLALCTIHHKLFDLGAFTLNADMKILVSERVSGSQHLALLLVAHHGQRITDAVQRENRPDLKYVSWHRAQVFKERPIPSSGEPS